DAPEAIEYAVKMQRFEQSALLDRMLGSGELTPQHLDALAASVAAFHSGIGRSVAGGAADAGYGTSASIEAPMLQNFEQIRPLLDNDEERAALARLEEWSRAAHAELSPLMEERRRAGYVRECHGDLHLGNITWIDGEIQVFDCIEFNPALRWIDVASEIAFTVMDLAARGKPAWGARFLNATLEITGDYAVLRLFKYYLVYRAMVRAKVARIRAAQIGAELREAGLHRTVLADYAEHIKLATSYTLPRQAALIITRGVSGSGKTTATQPLVEQLGAVRLRSDVERKRLHGLPREARSHAALNAELYAPSASLATYAELRRLAALALAAGYPAIVDATFLRRAWRDDFRALAAELRVPFLILECRADAAELRRRVAQRERQGQDASEATLAVLERQLREDEALVAEEAACALIIETQHAAPDEIVDRVRRRLAAWPG
ncbi:MAG: AAA family ATPase, partial [Pseudomonadota bacterium]